MKSRDVLRRLVVLADKGKISDAQINDILNGMIVNGTHMYIDGLIKHLDTGMVTSLSPDRIENVVWKPDVSIKPD